MPRKSHTCPHCRENYGVPLKAPPRVLKDPKALEAYVHKHVFPKVSAEMRLYLTQYFTVLFSDGFETGDFSAWSYTGGSPTVQSDEKHHGTYAMKCTATSDAAYKTGFDLPVAYVRVYFKFDSVPLETDLSSMFLKLFDSGWGNCGQVGVIAPEYGTYLKFSYPSSISYIPFTPDVNWHCFELHCVAGSGNGICSLYYDGDLKNSQTSETLNNFSFFSLEETDDVTIYFDCVVVADAYIGPEATATLQTVTDSLSLLDTAYRNKRLVATDTSSLADDLVFTGKIVVTADAVNFADSIIVNKVLQVTETIHLVETVQVGVGGAKKTRLFLLLGDLAVQLTGE